MLKDKNVVIGVSGGIAVYKICDLVSRLKKMKANVYVIMTKAATEFVSPLTFQSLSQNYVVVDMFKEPKTWDIEHISLAKRADLFVIAPATANIIGKIANGIADDMLTTTVMATKAPVVIAPAMNTNMYNNTIVQKNLKELKELGYGIIDPDQGRLACGDIGVGKLANNDMIIELILKKIELKNDYKGKNLLVTAGPTREWIDPVRYLSNPSSGKMGYSIAKAAIQRGANVTLISGPVNLEKPKGLTKFVNIETALEMYDAVMKYYEKQDIIIKTAAVSDYKPKEKHIDKVKKDKMSLKLELESNPDILYEIGKIKKNQILVGFAAETSNVIEEAKKKIAKKNLDYIVVNDVTLNGAGFNSDTNIVKIIDRNNNVKDYPQLSKSNLAHFILNAIIEK
ncbi:MAG: bifunctional phosphopantothenoylcysteine decarboxylase/phosphopantothenate--cysteine ligase CoaBC [Eubacteriales bacterium]